MRKKDYKMLPTEFAFDTKEMSTENSSAAFIKFTKSGRVIKNFKDHAYLSARGQKAKICHLCINKLPCQICEEGFCGGSSFLPNDELLPEYKKLKSSAQMAASMGYFYSSLAGWFRRLNTKEDKYYNKLVIPKSSGGERTLYAPEDNLKYIQQQILEKVLYRYIKFPDYVTGFVPKMSIVHNAKRHVGKSVVIKMDLKDFFPSCFAGRAKKELDKIFPDHVALMITRICSYKGHLAQGIPTSPYIANLLARDMDRELVKLCRSRRWDYSRYADDMTFSVKEDRKIVDRKVVDEFIKAVYPIVGRNCFRINSVKTRIMRRGKRQSVTGIIVNDKINIVRHWRDNLRATVHNCLKYGIESQKGKRDKGEFIRKINGDLSYARSVNKAFYGKVAPKWQAAKNKATSGSA